MLENVQQSNGSTLPIPAQMDGEELGKSDYFLIIPNLKQKYPASQQIDNSNSRGRLFDFYIIWRIHVP